MGERLQVRDEQSFAAEATTGSPAWSEASHPARAQQAHDPVAIQDDLLQKFFVFILYIHGISGHMRTSEISWRPARATSLSPKPDQQQIG